jgi:hypothetical protein
VSGGAINDSALGKISVVASVRHMLKEASCRYVAGVYYHVLSLHSRDYLLYGCTCPSS